MAFVAYLHDLLTSSHSGRLLVLSTCWYLLHRSVFLNIARGRVTDRLGFAEHRKASNGPLSLFSMYRDIDSYVTGTSIPYEACEAVTAVSHLHRLRGNPPPIS